MDWQFTLDQAAFSEQDTMASTALKNQLKLDPLGQDFVATGQYSSGKMAVFSGSIMLSGHAKNSSQRAIKGFFQNIIKKEKLSWVSGKDLDDFMSSTQWSDAVACLDANEIITNKEDYTSNPYYSIWSAYQKLSGDAFLSQTLDGFNEACVQLSKTPQFPIAEPIGFDYAKQFTELVKQTVQYQRHMAPKIDNEFNPIYCGNFRLNRLSLLDNFGVGTTIGTDATVFAEPLTDPVGDPFLKPRLTHPARLNFQWLSASQNSIASNDDTDTSPICGWLMNNYLDNTIAVYNAQGHALGYVDCNTATWNAVPWNTGSTNMSSDIQNNHLYNVLTQIIQSTTFSQGFLNATQNAQQNIAPDKSIVHNIKSMLMGRPIAVVRASVDLELQGLPALDQSWPSLLNDLSNCDQFSYWGYTQRNNKNWTQVAFPCRLGEHMQLNDGLIGYWMENNGVLNNRFLVPQTTQSEQSGDIISDTVNFPCQWLTLNQPERVMTMLMDPLGLIHATTGILPTKAISIPTAHYLPAMQRLKMWFRSSPLLQPKGLKDKIVLDLPKIPECQWKWWDPYQGDSSITATTNNAGTNAEIKEGWLLLENLES